MDSWYSKSLNKTSQAKANPAETAIQQAVDNFSQQMDTTILPQFYTAIRQNMAGIVQRFVFTVSQMMKDNNIPENQGLNMNALYLIMAEAARATSNSKGADITNSIKSSSINNQNLAMWRRQITNLAMQNAVSTTRNKVTTVPSTTGKPGTPGVQGQPGQPGAGGSAGSMQSSVSGQVG